MEKPKKKLLQKKAPLVKKLKKTNKKVPRKMVVKKTKNLTQKEEIKIEQNNKGK